MNNYISVKRVARIIVSAIILGWCCFTINTGLFVDENGLLSIYRGIYQGQKMFVDAWGPYQMAGILTYPLFVLYESLLKSFLMEMGMGLVLYFRIVYLILRLLICIYFYRTFRKTSFKEGAFGASAFVFLMILGYKSISYKTICDFGVLLFICFGVRFMETKKLYYCGLMGMAACIAILAYPTMIILPVVVVIIMFVMSYKGYELLRPVIVFIITCVILGALFIIYLQITSGLGQVFSQLKYLEDSDFDAPLVVRFGKMLLSYIVFAVAAYFPVLIIKLISKYRYVTKRTYGIVLSIYWAIFMVAICLLRMESISESRFAYGCLLASFWLPVFGERTTGDENYTVIGQYKIPNLTGFANLVFISIVSVSTQIAWALSTNQDISVPAHMSYYIVVAILLLINKDLGLELFGIFAFIAATFFGIFWVAEDNGGYSDITNERWIVKKGNLRGIALLPDEYIKNEAIVYLLGDNVTADDYLLVAFGSNSTGYLNSDAHMAAGSPYMRTHINDKLLKYWEVNPQDMADYVLIDVDSPKYDLFTDSACGKYIMENYTRVIDQKESMILLGR